MGNENQNQSGAASRSTKTPELNAAPSFTRGPWKVRAATFCDDGILSYEVVMPGEPQMNVIDARLIGKAPELHVQLTDMVERFERCAVHAGSDLEFVKAATAENQISVSCGKEQPSGTVGVRKTFTGLGDVGENECERPTTRLIVRFAASLLPAGAARTSHLRAHVRKGEAREVVREFPPPFRSQITFEKIPATT